MKSRKQFQLSLALALGAFMISSALMAQSQSGGAPPLRVKSRLVNVNVVAVDAEGYPVKDLKKEDFTVFDEGRSQQIAFFSATDNDSVAPEVAADAPDTYANRPASSATQPSAVVLLFDALNSKWASQGFALNRVRTFLRHIQPQDHIGIYVLGDELQVVHEVNGDASKLVEGIRRYDAAHGTATPAGTAPQDASSGDPALDRLLSGTDNRGRFELDSRLMKRGGQSYADEKREEASWITLSSFEAIARQLSTFPGRKSLIWVSDSPGPIYPFHEENLTEEIRGWRAEAHGGAKQILNPDFGPGPDLERTMRLMNGAGVAVYMVSAEGLQADDLGFADRPFASASPGGFDKFPSHNLSDHSVMTELAKRTGGRAFYNRNDLETGIRRALDDSRFTYEISYAPTHNQWNGEWRKIQVKLNRPGVTVLARAGYFALKDAPALTPKNVYQFLTQIAVSPLDSAQLGLSVHVGASQTAGGAQIDARVHIEPQRMLASQPNGHWAGKFELMFMQLDEKNRLLDATKKAVDADLNADEYAKVAKNGWDLAAQLKFMPGASVLCVILMDESSDEVGSVRIPLEHYAAQVSH
jgi:VWFA-related protein